MAFNVTSVLASPLFPIVRAIFGILALGILILFATRMAGHYAKARRGEIILEVGFGILIFMFFADPAFLLTLASYGAGLLISATKGL